MRYPALASVSHGNEEDRATFWRNLKSAFGPIIFEEKRKVDKPCPYLKISMMIERLEGLVKRYKEIERELSSPDVFRDMERVKKLSRERKELEPVIQIYQEYRRVIDSIKETEELLGDPELGELAAQELEKLKEKKEELEREIKKLLVPKDPYDERNIIMEIRAGAGGEEAALFARDLFRMYTKYAEKKGWKVEMVDSHPTDLGGFKEVIFMVVGKGAYSRLKYESGVHRVQRIPITESGGRIHTSTATVAVLPEMEDIDIKIDEKDLKIEFFRASGHGGQHVNKVETAVRITHIPTGIVVSCQEERSQHQNRQRAMKVLRARLYEHEREKKERELREKRRSQIGRGERSEKIRTYNFPQNRVTDHRINLTLYNLEDVLEGELDEIIDKLILKESEAYEGNGSTERGEKDT